MSGPTTKKPLPGIGSSGSAIADGARGIAATAAMKTADARSVGSIFLSIFVAHPKGSLDRGTREQQILEQHIAKAQLVRPQIVKLSETSCRSRRRPRHAQRGDRSTEPHRRPDAPTSPPGRASRRAF